MSIAVFPGGLRRPLLVFDSVTARRCTSIPLDPALSSFDLEERPGPDAAADSGRKRGGNMLTSGSMPGRHEIPGIPFRCASYIPGTESPTPRSRRIALAQIPYYIVQHGRIRGQWIPPRLLRDPPLPARSSSPPIRLHRDSILSGRRSSHAAVLQATAWP